MLRRKTGIFCGLVLCVLLMGAVPVPAVSIDPGGGFIPPEATEYDFTLPGQIVEIPYVVWKGDWWTGIAITNDSDASLTSVQIKFYTDEGEISKTTVIKTIFYQRTLAEIPARAMKVADLLKLYRGENISTSLPSEMGSLKIFHEGSQPFSVTVYIGNATGFSYQVFRSHSTQ